MSRITRRGPSAALQAIRPDGRCQGPLRPSGGSEASRRLPPPARLLIWLLILILILIFATSGGRAEGMRREVTGMDARQALRPQGWGLQRVLPGACP
ncbi:hypothetical protein EGJ15_01575 [Pseudomonas sp. p99-361]|nr:hypothetical protein EGJ15_01575 [Pseudomonas sp. p99-361]